MYLYNPILDKTLSLWQEISSRAGDDVRVCCLLELEQIIKLKNGTPVHVKWHWTILRRTWQTGWQINGDL
jgi:hypothetical protein